MACLNFSVRWLWGHRCQGWGGGREVEALLHLRRQLRTWYWQLLVFLLSHMSYQHRNLGIHTESVEWDICYVPGPDNSSVFRLSIILSNQCSKTWYFLPGLLSRALLTGNLNLAVDLCIEQDRFADAIVLAMHAGPEVLQETQRKWVSGTGPYNPFFTWQEIFK